MEDRKRKRVKEHFNGKPNTDGISSGGGDGPKRAVRNRQSDGIKSFRGQSDISRKTNKENYSKRAAGGRKGNIGKINAGKDVTAGRRPGPTAKLFKHKKVGKK